MNIHDIYRPILTFYRRKRVSVFYKTNRIGPESRILDVGGNMFFWNLAEREGFPPPGELVIMNVHKPYEFLPGYVTWIIADACKMPIRDKEFDVVFSNSVIEHVGNSESQRAMASEVRRVGKSHWVQTPDPRFPIEPHYLTPFIHWIPLAQRRRFVRNATVWGLFTRPDDTEVDRMLNEIRLIHESEFRLFFPESRIIVERSCGWPKALIAVQSPPD
jgi:hypothetical protein